MQTLPLLEKEEKEIEEVFAKCSLPLKATEVPFTQDQRTETSGETSIVQYGLEWDLEMKTLRPASWPNFYQKKRDCHRGMI